MAIALPMLESMQAVAAASRESRAVRRVAVVYVPNGIIMNDWLPTGAGRDFAFPRILKPLAAFRDDVTVISGLSNVNRLLPVTAKARKRPDLTCCMPAAAASKVICTCPAMTSLMLAALPL